MSFRARLTLFFVLIVIVPMISVTVVIFSLISNNEQAKANAAVAARLQAAQNLARAASFAQSDFRGGLLQATLLRTEASTAGSVRNSRLLVAGILIGFFLLSVVFALAVSRSLQAQVSSFLYAARRLGSGEFDTRVPTVG